MDKLKHHRKHYSSNHLIENNLNPDPYKQFNEWLEEAFAKEPREPNAMTLATVDENSQPKARIVLLKSLDDRGLVFYTNYQSAKAKELTKNASAALVFWWPYCERQVRIEGKVEKVTVEESDAYFETRGKASKLAALASNQSQPLKNRQQLEDAYANLERQFTDTDDIPRPLHWGGYRLIPVAFEFWQGGAHRLHDRIRYELIENTSTWQYFRLAP